MEGGGDHKRPARWSGLSRLSIGLAAILILGAFGGSPTGGGKVGGNIVFSWWGSAERNQKTYQIMQMYEKQHPGVTITPSPVGNFSTYWQKLTVEGAAKSAPCVTSMQTHYLPQYDRQHVLMPLNSLINSKAINISGIPKSLIQGSKGPDGKIYMIPTGAATNAMVWNQTMAKDAGLSPLTDNTTWSQYQQWLMKAVGHLPSGTYAANLSGATNDAMLFAWVLSHGGKVFKGNKLGFSAQTLENYWNWWLKLAKAGAATPPDMIAAEPTAEDQSYIATGKVMSAVSSSNFSAEQPPLTAAGKGTLAVTMWPRGSHGNGEVFDVSGLSISASCSNVSTAASFINYWTNNPQAAAVYDSDNGAVTVTKLLQKQINDPSTPVDTRDDLSLLDTMQKNNDPVFYYPPGYNYITENLPNAFEDAAFGKESVKQAATSFISQANAALAAAS